MPSNICLQSYNSLHVFSKLNMQTRREESIWMCGLHSESNPEKRRSKGRQLALDSHHFSMWLKAAEKEEGLARCSVSQGNAKSKALTLILLSVLAL